MVETQKIISVSFLDLQLYNFIRSKVSYLQIISLP